MYEQTAWRLDELFEGMDDPAIETALEELNGLVGQIESFRPKLTPDISEEDFNKVLSLNEEITQLFMRIGGYGSLAFSSDTQDQRAQTFMARVSQQAAEATNKTLFFSLWWKELDNANAERLIDSTETLRYWLTQLRLARPFTLTEAEEKVVNLKNVNGASAMNRLYSSITNRYVFEPVIDGEKLELSREQLMTHVRSTDPEHREIAYKSLQEVYAKDAPILGQIYQAMMRDWHSENVELRGYDSPLSVRNRRNDVPDEVVETLLSVVRKNAPLFHRFFEMKARWLGQEKLRRYDIYAPTDKTGRTYSFDESVELVLESFNEFEPRLGALAKRVLDEQHYDSENRKGKRGGAFCATLGPKYTPWVLQTFNGESKDVGTMAHELGHAVHSMLSEHHSVLTQQASLPMAETASTFSEMLLLDKMLATDPSPDLRREILFDLIGDAYATITRQAYFGIFEIEAHKAIQGNASVDDLCDLHLEILQEQFGDSVEISDEFRYEWVSIPHFYATPFYVYAYAFGQLLALALYAQYKVEGEAMIPRFIDILAAGGSEAPVTVLRKAGIDIYAQSFWQSGFDYLATQLEQLEAIPVPA